MTLYEIWYHDEWHTKNTYRSQYIGASEEDTKQWLMIHLDEWHDDEDVKIDDIITQSINQDFIYMTVTPITINKDGTVDWF